MDEQVCLPDGTSYRQPSAAPKITLQEGLALTAQAQQQDSNETTLRQQADAALTDLRAYRDLASPTNAQTVQAVKLLCRVCIGLIRLLLRKIDGTA